MMKKVFVLACCLLTMVSLSGCGSQENADVQTPVSVSDEQPAAEETRTVDESADAEASQKTVVIDPGHSSIVSGEMEPLGPGASEMKAADSTGTQGVVTGVPEYVLTLEVSQKLQRELEARGYTAILTRDTNDVALSCAARAAVANDAAADAFVRIHANGSEDQSVQGAMTICITPENPFYSALYPQARALSEQIIEALCAETGCENDGVWETDTMSGNNWSQMPATIVEMGYMTNPAEDQLMASGEYQDKIVQGIADGIDAYLAASEDR